MLTFNNLEAIIDIAENAGRLIMEVYSSNDFNVEFKSDNSPLTIADKKSHNYISTNLKKLFPDIPVLSEEGRDIPYEERKNWEIFWLVDPLDGTKEFVKRNDEFAINIALIYKDYPVFGLINLPALHSLYFALQGEGAFSKLRDEKPQKITLQSGKKLKHINALVSRSHISDNDKSFLGKINDKGYKVNLVSAGSSYKQCLVANGEGDVYPRFGRTFEWDTAAGQVIVEETGGETIDLSTNKTLRYNKEDLRNPNFIMMNKEFLQIYETHLQ